VNGLHGAWRWALGAVGAASGGEQYELTRDEGRGTRDEGREACLGAVGAASRLRQTILCYLASADFAGGEQY